MNIKGVFQVWMHDGSYHEIPLKEAHGFTREGCKSCPGLRRRARRHLDRWASVRSNDWTLTIVRTERGREVFHAMVADDAVEIRPVDDDPGAIALLRKLSRVSPEPLAGDGRSPCPGRLPAPAAPPEPPPSRTVPGCPRAAPVAGSRPARRGGRTVIDVEERGHVRIAHWRAGDNRLNPESVAEWHALLDELNPGRGDRSPWC